MKRPLRPFGLATLLALAACASGGARVEQDPTAIDYAPELEVDFAAMTQTSSGLWYHDVAVGTGKTANRGDRAWIHYIGTLPAGTIVDSSLGGPPFAFELGSPDVIRGWNQGIIGMKVGGRRRIVIRPTLAYGWRGRGDVVPANTTLVFEIQLVDAN